MQLFFFFLKKYFYNFIFKGKVSFRIDYTPPAGGPTDAKGSGADDRQVAEGNLDAAEDEPDPVQTEDGTPIPPGPEGDAIRAAVKSR